MTQAAPALSVRPVADVVGLLAAYRDAIGAQAMCDAYGPHWPRPRLDGEEWFEFWSEGSLVGWGSLLPDHAERVMWHSHGIWPMHQAAGHTPAISRWLRAWAFEHSACVAVGARILDTNPRFRLWMRRRFGPLVCKTDGVPQAGWEYAGHLTLPAPGADVYMLSRASWEAHERVAVRAECPPAVELEREARAQAAQI
jgi:hypothetical protein